MHRCRNHQEVLLQTLNQLQAKQAAAMSIFYNMDFLIQTIYDDDDDHENLHIFMYVIHKQYPDDNDDDDDMYHHIT